MMFNFNFRLLALALVAALFQLAALANPISAEAAPPELATSAFNPATLGSLNCGDVLGWFSWAKQDIIFGGIAYLRGVNNWCDSPPRTCTRVSCSYNSVIYLCNDRDDHIYITCPDVADYADWIMDKCGYTCTAPMCADIAKGQLFDLGNWNVLIRGDSC